MRHTIFIASISGLILAMLFSSCNPAKYVPADQHLLYSSKIRIKDKSVKPDALKSYIRQKPNKKIFGFIRFHLGLYNLSDINKETGINKFLRRIGEEPVIYDPGLTEKSLNQLDIYMKNKGYYYATIRDSVFFTGKKAHVIYYVEGGKPYTIRNISHSIEDTTIRRIYLADSANTLLKPGELFDKDVLLQNERIRIERLLKTNGYYNFSREYVVFYADTFPATHQVDLQVQIQNPFNSLKGSEIPHKQYKIRHIVVSAMPDLMDTGNVVSTTDTLAAGTGIFLTDTKKLKINPRSFVQFIYIQPDQFYNENSVDETYTHISSLNLFKLVDIKFNEISNIPDTSRYQWLDCNIRLSPSPLQSYSTDLEGTNSSGNIGGAVNLNYQHINLFGNAEVLDMKFRGALESLKESKSNKISRSEEFGAEANIRFPTFLIPVRNTNFIKKYNPKTTLSLSYNYQFRPDFTRTVANAGFGYNWRETRYKEHIFRPFEINYVDSKISDEFNAFISGTYLESSYRDHLITSMSYSYIYNSQNIKKTQNFDFFRLNAESAGNVLSLFNPDFEKVSDTLSSYYKFLGKQYSQYVRGDIEYKYYNIINSSNTTVYRAFAGLAYPYGNARAIPFEKQYFSGGSNGLRGWQVRSLGPGSYVDTTKRRFPNSTADIKLELNFEYRFKLFWKLEGAFFMDAGNIWAVRKEDNREGALFQWDKFYKEFALDSGLGLRFDFSFFLFRTDFGMKMRDPSRPEGNRWIVGKTGWNGYAINIGIGYPF